MIWKKTDNHNITAKVDLRMHFLKKYHPIGTARVLDCCMGSGQIWNRLRTEWTLAEYVGLDLKHKKGRLKIDSSRYLEAGGWEHDCIDIDTYGSPWKHWINVLKFAQIPCTVFLTVGRGGPLGVRLSNIEIDSMGIIMPTIKKLGGGITHNLSDLSIRSCLALCLKTFYVVEAIEAINEGNARYFGIRLEVRNGSNL